MAGLVPAIHGLFLPEQSLSVIAGLDPAIHAMTLLKGIALRLHPLPAPATAVLLNRHGMDSGSRRFAARPE
jgi:hypothetical protein